VARPHRCAGRANKRRVVVTGLGVVAPNAIGKDRFWKNLLDGVSAVGHITAFDASAYKTQIAAEATTFAATDFLAPKTARRLWRFTQLAVASAQLALEDAGTSFRSLYPPTRTAVCFGTSVSGMGDAEALHRSFLSQHPSRRLIHTVTDCPPHAAASYVALEHGILGPTLTISSNCCTGLDVIRAASTQILTGSVDAAIVGAAEAPIFPMILSGFSALGLLSTRNDDPPRASRPYDSLRDGLVLGEGAGCIILEELDSALLRGAEIYAEVAGYATAIEATDMRRTDTSGSTMASVIRQALGEASLQPADLDYINAHGSSLRDYDLCDINAIKLALGAHAYSIPLSSIKSMLGQAISASGVFQTASSCLAIRDSALPPTINLDAPDPLCDLDCIPHVARRSRVNNVLINAHGIGGALSALVITRLRLPP
jgi:3-oxoacyl-[acyl-carrier-protein] synthase II